MSFTLNTQQLVQIGFYQFTNINAKRIKSTGLKSQLSDTAYTDGKIKNNGLNRDYKNDLEFSITIFCENDKDDIHALRKMMFDEPQIVFFVEKFNSKPPYGRLNNGGIDYKILYNYMQIISPFEESEDTFLGNEGFLFKFNIRLMTPFFYECDFAKLSYVPIIDLPKFKGQVWGSYNQLWGENGVWGSDILTNAKLFNKETIELKKLLLEDNDNCRPNILFMYDDIFYANNKGTITTGDQKNNRYIEFDLPLSTGFTSSLLVETNKPLLIESDLFSGQGLDLITTSKGVVNQIEIRSYSNGIQNAEALVNNERISIYNLNTKSGFVFKWTSDVPAPEVIIIKSHVQSGVFDQNGNMLNPYKEYAGKYTLDFVQESNSNYLLEFRSLYPYNSNINLEQNDTLEIKHNILSTTQRIPKIIIKNLKTWH